MCRFSVTSFLVELKLILLLCQKRPLQKGHNSLLLYAPLQSYHTKPFQKISFTFLLWSDAETSFLLTMYQENMQNVGPLRKYRNKMALWNGISDDINKKLQSRKTGGQVADKYKNVLAIKKSVINVNKNVM
jgi:hypothetical protein